MGWEPIVVRNLTIYSLHTKWSPQRWTLWDPDDTLADKQVTKLDLHTSHEYDFNSPSTTAPASLNQYTSPFDEPLTFYSYASSSQVASLNPQTLLEWRQLKVASPFPPRSTTASSWSQSLENSPPRTVQFLDETPLTTEQELLSSRHQVALKEAHCQGKMLHSREW